ncbi:hypothetical protein [Sinomonas soli]
MNETTTAGRAPASGTAGQDASVLLTDHEILALLSFGNGPGTAMSRRIFRLEAFADNALLTQAGTTTLVVRGLAEVDGEDLVLKEPVATIGAILLAADEWLEIALVTPSAESVVFGVGAPGGALMVNLDRRGTQRFYPAEPGGGLLRGALAVARDYLQAAPDGLPAAVSVTRHVAGAEPRAAHLKAAGDGTFELAVGRQERPPARTVAAPGCFDEFAAALGA